MLVIHRNSSTLTKIRHLSDFGWYSSIQVILVKVQVLCDEEERAVQFPMKERHSSNTVAVAYLDQSLI